MKTMRWIFLLCTAVTVTTLRGQLTLTECQLRAAENYPLVARYDLIRAAEQYDLSNANKGYLPQVSLSGKATLQSDVTSLPIELPNMVIPKLSKDQYQVAVEVDQVIWDGGNIKARKDQINASSQVDRQQQQVDMYGLRDRINSLYFGILLLEDQLTLNRLYAEELGRNYRKVESFVANGVATASDLNAVEVEQLSNRQQRAELEATRGAYRRMLGAFIGANLDSTELRTPEINQEMLSDRIVRPELELFDARDRQLDAQVRQIRASGMPQISFFVQGAYGRPGLNMLINRFKPFAVGGVRLSWNFGRFYTRNNDLRNIENARGNIGVQRDVFLFNTRQQIASGNAEIEKYRRTLSDDDRIVLLREKIQQSSEAKVAEGTMSVLDYMQEVIRTETARRNRLLHRVQLLMSLENMKNITNQ